jgi:probable HAF family extracellular repeat protein
MNAHQFPRCALSVLLLLTIPAARAQTYVYELESISAPIELGPDGDAISVANDVNDAGNVVGWAQVSRGTPYGFLYRYGAMQDITSPFGSFGAYANGINNNGEVVGHYVGGGTRAFYWHDSTQLLTLNAGEDPPTHSEARAINDYGRIVGHTRDPGNCNSQSTSYGGYGVEWEHAYAPRHVVRCPGAASDSAHAYDVNNAAAIVGLDKPPTAKAWIWSGDSKVLPLALWSTCHSEAKGINESGTVVGSAFFECGPSLYAILWSGTPLKAKSLGALPGGDESEAREINDQAFVAGYSEAQIYTGGLSFVRRDRGFIWHAHFGMKALPILPGTDANANCQANSLNNRSLFTENFYVVGYCTNAAGKMRAVRWIVKTKKKALPDTPPVQL